MIDHRIEGYIKENLQKGYTKDAIRTVLIQNGYPQQNVDDTIRSLDTTRENIEKKPPIPIRRDTPSQERQINSDIQNHHSDHNKRMYILMAIGTLILIIGALSFLFIGSSGNSISGDAIAKGTTFSIEKEKDIIFELQERKHRIILDSIKENSAKIIIESEPKEVELTIGEEKKVDINDDGTYDIVVKLKSIDNDIPNIYIKQIEENICTESWECLDWDDCSPDGKKERTCIDRSSCGTEEEKPMVRQECEYNCTADWVCEDWQTCIKNGTQIRICEDENDCRNNESIPLMVQNCTFEETCVEDWDCTEWENHSSLSIRFDTSTGGSGGYNCTRERECSDINDCGTEDDKPILVEQRECTEYEEQMEAFEIYNEEYKNCIVGANYTTSLFGIKEYQEIVGPQGELCEIMMKYIENPDPDIIGLEMTCVFDTSGGLESMKVMSEENCQGERWDYEQAGIQEGGTCSFDMDCSDELDCIDNRCVTPITECSSSSDCGTCENCLSGEMICRTKDDSKLCMECESDGDCKEGFVCNQNKERSFCAECSFIEDCDDKMLCLNGACSEIETVSSEYLICDYENDEICQETCSNCKTGTYTCSVIDYDFDTEEIFSYCLECGDDSDCKLDYVCRNNACISG